MKLILGLTLGLTSAATYSAYPQFSYTVAFPVPFVLRATVKRALTVCHFSSLTVLEVVHSELTSENKCQFCEEHIFSNC